MSDSVVVNVISPQTTSITVNDTGESIYINPLTLNQGIINHSVTHQSGGSDELFHNLLGGLQGGSSGNYYHLTSGQYANLVTGAVIRPSETGVFYLASNPSGFITGVDLSAYVTGSVVRPNETGYFIDFNTFTGDRGDITITGTSQNDLNFSIDNLAVTSGKIANSAVTTNKIADFSITTAKLASLAVTTNIIASNSVTNVKLADMAQNTIKGRISVGTSDPEDLSSSQVRTLINFDSSVSGLLSEYVTGSVVRPSETGAFYAASNPSGFITGVDLSAYVTGLVVRPSETGNFITSSQTGVFYPTSNPSGFVTGSVVRPYETGSFITNSQTGVFYPTSNPSGFALTVSPARTTLTGDGATSIYAISGAGSLTNPSALIVATDGALQEPGVDYSVSGGYITFTSPLVSGAKAVVVSPTNTIQVLDMIPSDGSVTSAKLTSGLSIPSPSIATPIITSPTITGTPVINSTVYTYGTGAATAHKAALDLFTLLTVVESDIGTFVANGGTAAGGSDGDSLNLTTATANLRPNVYRFRNWNRNPGNSGAANVVMPVSLASAGNILHGGAAGNGASLRCGFGMVNGALAVAADANATTGKGFGWRMAWNVSTSRFEFNLWAHDGTTYVEGTGIDTGITTGNFDAFFNIIVRLASDGTVTANTWFGNNVALSVPSLTPTVTLAGGPTSGTFANLGTPSWLAASHSTVAPSVVQSIIAKIINRKLLIG